MAQTQNQDIAGYIRRLRRFRFELGKSASGNVAFMSNADADRLRSYISSLNAYKQWFQNEEPLDLPETHGNKFFELGEPEQLPVVENESIMDIINMLESLENELHFSQSSRLANRLISHDENRVDKIINRITRMLEDYIMQVLPLDLPESSPLRANVSSGRLGSPS